MVIQTLKESQMSDQTTKENLANPVLAGTPEYCQMEGLCSCLLQAHTISVPVAIVAWWSGCHQTGASPELSAARKLLLASAVGEIIKDANVKCYQEILSSKSPLVPRDGQRSIGTEADSLLAKLRADGWSVAIHNDYRQGGVPHTFWLFTKDGFSVKGEARTDIGALEQVDAEIKKRFGGDA